MLVIMQNQQILSPEKICHSCLLANNGGQPRWQEGKLGCGQCLGKLDRHLPTIYQCHMGFRLANIE